MNKHFSKEWIDEICLKIGMPEEAKQDIIKTEEHLSINEVKILQYQYQRLINSITEISAAADMQSMVNNDPLFGQKIMMVYLMAAKHTKEIYIDRGITLNVFYDTMKSFAVFEQSYKFEHGVWGFDKPYWAVNHLRMNLYRLGRLVFERAKFPFNKYKLQGEIIKKGDNVLMVHIPANEKLELGLCQESYNIADKFSKKHFNFISKAFCCSSWLMHRGLENILQPQSNITKFQKEYEIINETVYNEEPLKWIFGKTYESIDDYPLSTTLQKNVIKYLKNNGELGVGFGVRNINTDLNKNIKLRFLGGI